MASFQDIRSFDEAKQLASFLVKKYKKGVEVAGFSDSKSAAEAILRQELNEDDREPPAEEPVVPQDSMLPVGGNPPPMLVQQVAAHLKGLSQGEKEALVDWEHMATQNSTSSAKLERFESKHEAKLHEENTYLKRQIEFLSSKLYGQEEAPPGPSQPASYAAPQQQQEQQPLQPPDDEGENPCETTLQGAQRRQEVEKYLLSKGAPLDEASTVDEEVFEKPDAQENTQQPAKQTAKRNELRKAIDDLLKPTSVPLPSHSLASPSYTPAPVTVVPAALPSQPFPTNPPLSDTKAYFWDAYNKEINKAFPNHSSVGYQPQPASISSPLANYASLSSPQGRKQGAIMSPPITPSRPVF